MRNRALATWILIGRGAGLRFVNGSPPRPRARGVRADQHDRNEAGAHAFIRKPFESLTLVSTARDLIGTSAIARGANRALSG